MEKMSREQTKDKCNLCGWTGPSSDVVQNKALNTWHCPVCNSEDIDDIDDDPYAESEEDEGWLT